MSHLEIARNSYNSKRPTAFIVKVKKNLNGELDELKAITMFLDSFYTNPPISQRVKHYISNDLHMYTCPICLAPLEYREKPNPGYNLTCGNDECRKKQNYASTQNAIRKKYGVDNISQTVEWKEKVKETNLKKRGVEWITQSNQFIEKSKKHNSDNKHAILSKRNCTNNKRYGSNSPLGNVEIRKKGVQTIYKKYGVYSIAHVAEIADKREKTSYRTKKYITPSGNERYLQGYEPFYLDYLFARGYKEDDVITGHKNIERYIGKITYVGLKKKTRRYYPDIFIVSENKVVEIKSTYTLSKDKDILNKKNAILKGWVFI